MHAVIGIKKQFNNFAFRFILLFLVLNLAVILLPDAVHGAINSASARMLAGILELFTFNAQINNDIVRIPGFSVQIIPECTGIHASLLFVCFTLAYEAPLRDKAFGILYAVPALIVFNFLRLAGITIFGAEFPDYFEYIHIFVAQALVIAVVFAACLIWLAHTSPQVKQTILPAFIIRFLGLLSLFFFIWAIGNGWYVQLVEWTAQALLSIDGSYSGPTTYGPFYDPKTFNLVTFTALLTATRGLELKRKLWGLAVGIAVLTANHIALNIAESSFYSFDMHEARYFAIVLNFIGQLFLPFFLWTLISKEWLFRKKGIYSCPICGEEKFGIVQHIIAKHGEQALESHEIQEHLSNQGVNLEGSR